MDLIANIQLGLETALTLRNLFYCLVGVFLGTLIGVLPGLGPTATIAMLLPITFALPPISSLIMLAGIYYGSQYGGSTTSILVNLPGEAASVVTTLGRLSDGEAGEGRSRASHCRHGVVLCRNGRHILGRGFRTAAGGDGASIRAGGLFFTYGARPGCFCRACPRITVARHRHGRARTSCWD